MVKFLGAFALSNADSYLRVINLNFTFMERRSFLRNTAGTIAAFGLAVSAKTFASEAKDVSESQFKLKYAPGFGTFKEHAGDDLFDQIKFISDQGFRAIFDNGLMKKEPAIQEKIAAELARRNMDLGPFVLYADFAVKSMVSQDPAIKDMLRKKMEEGVECAKRTGAKWALVVPGRFDESMEWDYQTANVIDNMKMCCEVVEKSGLVLVMEPLNAWTNHPGLFLTKIPQAHMICEAVNHPSCKLVNDLYHQQITEGNLIPNIDKSWDSIAAFHIGDNPGRNEPTTGEINYNNVFKHIHSKGYNGVLCCEHGKSIKGKEGELAFIKAYREVDLF
jgi:hydroxypyruvate isomerase